MRHRVSRFLAQHRRSALVSKVGRILRFFYLGYENLDYDPLTNGEAFVAKVVGAHSDHGVVFDVGANQGDWSAMAAPFFCNGKIIAFEVIPSVFERLLRHCRDYPNVSPHHLGLSDRDGTQDFFFSDDRTELASAVEGIHGSYFNTAKIAVTVARGDTFWERAQISKIDFLKIDVEGFEPNVLRGFETMLARQQIKAIQFEYNIASIRTKFLLRDFYELLGKHGMVIGKIFPNYVDFREYGYDQEDFLGPNYLSVQSKQTELIAALSGK